MGGVKQMIIEKAERLFPGNIKKQEKYMADVLSGKEPLAETLEEKQKNNRTILKAIAEHMEAFPGCRFLQILNNMNIIKTGVDEYHLESGEIVARMKRADEFPKAK